VIDWTPPRDVRSRELARPPGSVRKVLVNKARGPTSGWTTTASDDGQMPISIAAPTQLRRAGTHSAGSVWPPHSTTWPEPPALPHQGLFTPHESTRQTFSPVLSGASAGPFM
jgi:hypothetical protein